VKKKPSPIDQAERLRLCARLLAARDPDAVRALCALYRAAGYGRLAAALEEALAAGRWAAIEGHARAVAAP
jgi:hypothetical protein